MHAADPRTTCRPTPARRSAWSARADLDLSGHDSTRPDPPDPRRDHRRALHRHRRLRHVGARGDVPRPWHPGVGFGPCRQRGPPRARRARRRRARRARRGEPAGRRRHRHPHRRDLAGEPRVPPRQGARPARHPPLAGPALADRRSSPRERRRRARQDDLDGHDRHGPPRPRHRPHVRQRGSDRRPRRLERHRLRRPVRHRGRRVGRHVPALRHVDRAHHERRPRPPRPLGHPRRVLRRVRALRRRRPRGRRDQRRRPRRGPGACGAQPPARGDLR